MQTWTTKLIFAYIRLLTHKKVAITRLNIRNSGCKCLYGLHGKQSRIWTEFFFQLVYFFTFQFPVLKYAAFLLMTVSLLALCHCTQIYDFSVGADNKTVILHTTPQVLQNHINIPISLNLIGVGIPVICILNQKS